MPRHHSPQGGDAWQVFPPATIGSLKVLPSVSAGNKKSVCFECDGRKVRPISFQVFSCLNERPPFHMFLWARYQTHELCVLGYPQTITVDNYIFGFVKTKSTKVD